MSTAINRFSGSGEKKSSFAMTCNRLSLLLKQKGGLRDFAIDSTRESIPKPEISSPATEMNMTTSDFLSNLDIPVVRTSEKTEKSVDLLLPKYVNLDSFCKPDGSANKAVSKTANMTIFYRGEVLVFDHISAEKARDMMLTARGNQIQNRIPLKSTSNSPYEGLGSQEDQILHGLRDNGSDLPIARRSSLHKFLAKRKERATERGPYYQFSNRLISASSSSSYQKFDLNL